MYLNEWLRRVGLIRLSREVVERIQPDRRRKRQFDLRELREMSEKIAPLFQGIRDRAACADKSVLISGMSGLRYILQQVPLVAGFAAAGYRPVVVLVSPADRVAVESYSLIGVRDFVFWDEQELPEDFQPVERPFAAVRRQEDLLDIQWRGNAVGRYALSTLMRLQRRGRIDLADPGQRRQALKVLRATFGHALAAETIMERYDPTAVVTTDRGYTPQGPLFDAGVNRGVSAYSMNVAHRDNTLMLKRYGHDNRHEHPSALSLETWSELLAMPWSEERWRELREEIELCYESGQWYAEVGTQFHKRFFDKGTLQGRLGLDETKKTVLVVPHIFWDATFFWGRDLFADYEAWFVETMRLARSNDSVNWIVKVHPANAIKDTRDGVTGTHSEVKALNALGPIPGHIKLLGADTEISTLSLFRLADYCLTVRGTSGIEAACYGARVVTGGTGRYDGLGFTVDPQSREAYLKLLSSIADLPGPTPEEIERARRYAYGVFLCRPLHLTSWRFGFRQDEAASLEIYPPDDTGQSLVEAPDIAAMAKWIRSETPDFLGREPPTAEAETRGRLSAR